MKNKKGEGYVSTCVMIVVICMLLSVFVTFAVAVNTVKTVERNSRVVLDSFVMQNSIEIYDSIKQGNNETNEIDADEYREALSDRYYCPISLAIICGILLQRGFASRESTLRLSKVF